MIKKGFVYVISTENYYKQEVFKIGHTKCIERRLKQFNNTRVEEDKFIIHHIHKTINYRKLESLIHQELEQYKLKNELFKISLDIIKKTIDKIVNTGVFNHIDVIFDKAVLYKLVYQQDGNSGYWSIHTDDGLKICMNKDSIYEYITKWLQIQDRYDLYKYISDEYYYSLFIFLKTNFTQTNLINAIASLSIDCDTDKHTDSVYDLNDKYQQLTINCN